MKLICYEDIQSRLKEIAGELDKKFDEITLLITLTGGVYTGVDLSKYLKIPCKLEFAKISSYGSGETSVVIDLKWISAYRGKHLGNVLIIDDICDTGKTLEYLVRYIKYNYEYSSLNTFTLLNKSERREVTIEPDYIGFEVPNKFLYGYGLDDDEYKRNVEYIYCKD